MPCNWACFLRVNKKKTDLFALISDSVATISVPTGKEVVATRGSSVIGQPLRPSGMDELNSSHKEAETRIFVHVTDRGHSYITVRTTYSDVVVIAVSVIQYLS